MLHSAEMREGDSFTLTPQDPVASDVAWPSAILFETLPEIYRRVYSVLRPNARLPDVTAHFHKFANPDSIIRSKNGALEVQITDILERAPAPIQESLAFILLGKLLRKKIAPIHHHRYRLHLSRREVRGMVETRRKELGRKLHKGSQGAYFDLREIFERLNHSYFGGLMARPELGWSLQRSRTRLGHFDPAHNTIIISRIFDREGIDPLALDYVMYHEMLHLRHPVEHSKGRRCIHTKEFKAAEKQFTGCSEAKKLLKRLQ